MISNSGHRITKLKNNIDHTECYALTAHGQIDSQQTQSQRHGVCRLKVGTSRLIHPMRFFWCSRSEFDLRIIHTICTYVLWQWHHDVMKMVSVMCIWAMLASHRLRYWLCGSSLARTHVLKFNLIVSFFVLFLRNKINRKSWRGLVECTKVDANITNAAKATRLQQLCDIKMCGRKRQAAIKSNNNDSQRKSHHSNMQSLASSAAHERGSAFNNNEKNEKREVHTMEEKK